MYFPFLRGKQFELLALRDMPSIVKRNDRISPIIEPIKENTGLNKAVIVLKDSNFNFTIIINPSVGDLKSISNPYIIDFINVHLKDYNNFQIGYFVNNDNDLILFEKILQKRLIGFKKLLLIFMNDEDFTEDIVCEFYERYAVQYTLLYEQNVKSRSLRRMLRGKSLVTFDDPFTCYDRNSDYTKKVDEKFTEEFLYFKEENYLGFSDYLTVGSPYSDSGFMPYAVVIHLSYLTVSNESIRVRHFVSDTIDDSYDVAGKFKESLDKLIEFTKQLNYTTYAIDEFKKYHNTGAFPGLGYIKKLSILNHLEIINKVI